MKKVELLSPAGNMEMAHLAIHNGADAIYLAGKSYGARKFAQNFNEEELIEVIQYAHLYGVKVYVTVNTIIYEHEIEDALNYIEFLYKNNVDALIMQDIGLITLTRKYFPNLEIHASTQCHNHNDSGLELWKKLGIKRAVLDREMTKEEIKQLKIDIEKEVFIYGALCICYSGCCLFSSLNGGRSGNRGECVGSCRMPYKLIENNKVVTTEGNYLLSAKELNTLDHLDELIDLDIDSFKIEGRMKSPSYVGYVTRCARNIIDAYYEGKQRKLTEEEKINLKKLFNRGFTKGYILNENNITNIKTPNHQGIEIGEVLGITNNKIKIKITNDTLNQEDGIRFTNSDTGMIVNRLYDKKGLLVNKLEKNEIGYIDKKDHIKNKDIILKTIDNKLNKSLEDYIPKRIPITIEVTCKINKPIKIKITDGKNHIEKYGDIIEKSTNKQVESIDIEKQLKKLGNTPYILAKINIEKDNNIFIRLSNLNALRRELTDELTKIRKEKRNYEVKLIPRIINELKKQSSTTKKKIHILTRTEEQLKECLKYKPDSIYTTNKYIYEKYKNNKNIYLRIDRVNTKENNIKESNLLVGDLGSTYLYSKDNTVITDYYLNIVNHASIDLLNQLKVKRITLSVELGLENTKELIEKISKKEKIEVLIYGRRELMIMKHNLKNGYLEDKFKNRYPIITENNLTHILEKSPLDNIEKIKEYQEIGIENYRIELWNESPKEIEKIFQKLKEI